MKRFAEILSAIFIPLFAPTYLCIIILLFFHDMTGLRGLPQELIFVLLTFLVTCAPPFLVVYLLFRIVVIKSLSLEHRKDRRIPQAVGCLNYLWITVFLEMRFGSAHIFSVVMLSTTSLVFLIAIITQFWKISTHAAGMFGMMTVLLLLKYDQPAAGYDVLCWLFALATVLVCISRVYLGIHTVMQILAGSALATGVTMIVFYMFGKGM